VICKASMTARYTHVADSVVLRRQSSGLKPSANNGLVPKHRSLNRAPAVVAGTPLPAHASMLFNRCNMPIALRGCSLIRSRRCPRRNLEPADASALEVVFESI
jgi:hypothetical protein